MTLYELTDQYIVFINMIESGEIPEEAIADTLESICGELDQKIDSIACVLKQFIAEGEAIKAELDRLTERKKAKEKAAERIKTYLSETLIALDKLKFESPRNKISFRKSNSLDISDEAAFLEYAEKHDRNDLLSYKPPVINKTGAKDAIARGEAIPGVEIKEKLNMQLK